MSSGVGVAVGKGVGAIVGVDVDVSEAMSVAVAEKVTIGETGEPSVDTAGLTGFELHAALNDSTSNRIARNFRRI